MKRKLFAVSPLMLSSKDKVLLIIMGRKSREDSPIKFCQPTLVVAPLRQSLIIQHSILLKEKQVMMALKKRQKKKSQGFPLQQGSKAIAFKYDEEPCIKINLGIQKINNDDILEEES